MDMSVFYLTTQDLEETLAILDTAIQNHRQWSDKLHTAMLCGQDFPSDILHQASHTKCEFGKWYYGKLNDAIHSFSEYAELEEVHQQMHNNARILAELCSQDKAINVDQYQRFLDKQRQLITLLYSLHGKLLEHQHSIDTLTGVANRKSINLLIEQMFENTRRYHYHYSVAMLDADYFKRINDEYGHMIGDQVLRHISSYLKRTLRKSDSIGRYGGEEFLIMLPETDQASASLVMEKCLEGLAAQAFHVDGYKIHVTASVGISQVHDDDDDAWQAVKRADFALYRAKETGRNKVLLSE